MRLKTRLFGLIAFVSLRFSLIMMYNLYVGGKREFRISFENSWLFQCRQVSLVGSFGVEKHVLKFIFFFEILILNSDCTRTAALFLMFFSSLEYDVITFRTCDRR